MTEYTASVAATKKVTLSGNIKVNAYESGISKITFTIDSSFIDDDYYYYIVFKHAEMLYAIPLIATETSGEFTYTFGASITKTAGLWNAMIMVTEAEYGSTGLTDEDVVIISDVFRVTVAENPLSVNVPDIELPPDPNIIAIKNDVAGAIASLTAVETAAETAESARASAETNRASAEDLRAAAELLRAAAETLRAEAESARATAETARDSAETARASAETDRALAESTRASGYSAMMSAAAEAIETALAATGPKGDKGEKGEKGDKGDGGDPATTSVAGVVKPDGTTITVDADGTIHTQSITVDSELSATSENPVQNKIVKAALDGKVATVEGKGLSANDYTAADKAKVDVITTTGDGASYLANDGTYKAVESGDATVTDTTTGYVYRFVMENGSLKLRTYDDETANT